jgi:hypothetical protein
LHHGEHVFPEVCMSPRKLAASMLVALAPLTQLACGASADIASVGPDEPHPAEAGTVAGPFIQAGSMLVVRLDSPIDTFDTAPGTHFTATVVAPMYMENGFTLVKAGAKVQGTLVSSGTPESPHVRLSFESIETTRGSVPLRAVLRSTEHYDWQGPPLYTPGQALRWPYDFGDYHEDTAPAGALPGRPVEGRAMMQPREIHVPWGAVMRLQVTEPVLLPGSRRLR